MLERMSSSQFSQWRAYFRLETLPHPGHPIHPTLALPSKAGEGKTVGEGKLGLEDWKRMSQDERKQQSHDLYDLARTWAVLSQGAVPGRRRR